MNMNNLRDILYTMGLYETISFKLLAYCHRWSMARGTLLYSRDPTSPYGYTFDWDEGQ